MDEWASVYGTKVGFVCASCAGPELARTFGERLKLKHCNNVWLDEKDMPTWGQLGCNGFIILNESHLVKCNATPAFLKVNKEAFRFVEDMLSSLLAVENCPNFRLRPPEAGESNCAKIRFGDAIVHPIPSVKVDVLDVQHHECEEALNILREKQDSESLVHLIKKLEAHFRDEESLLDKYIYNERNSSSSGFSADMNARTSHFADHANILEEIRGYSKSILSESVINSIRERFYLHTTQYDLNYAECLSEAMK